jgi:hypothetical protein
MTTDSPGFLHDEPRWSKHRRCWWLQAYQLDQGRAPTRIAQIAQGSSGRSGYPRSPGALTWRAWEAPQSPRLYRRGTNGATPRRVNGDDLRPTSLRCSTSTVDLRKSIPISQHHLGFGLFSHHLSYHYLVIREAALAADAVVSRSLVATDHRSGFAHESVNWRASAAVLDHSETG